MIDQGHLIIWDIRRGEVMRTFEPDVPAVWPTFKWSKDDKYFAKVTVDQLLSIYETPVSKHFFCHFFFKFLIYETLMVYFVVLPVVRPSRKEEFEN